MWEPRHFFFVGGQGVGKSTICSTLAGLLGDRAVMLHHFSLAAFILLLRSDHDAIIVDSWDDEREQLIATLCKGIVMIGGGRGDPQEVPVDGKTCPRVFAFASDLSADDENRLRMADFAVYQLDRFDPHGGQIPDSRDYGPFLPRDCPVTPLGVDGPDFIYRSVTGEITHLSGQQHCRSQILALFAGKIEWLHRWFPRKGGGWKPELAAEALMQAAAKRGRYTSEDAA